MQQRSYELLVRLGYVARGVVYLLIGGLALVAAFGGGGKTVGTKGALAELLSHPFGSVLLATIAAGFLCFALWRFAQGLLDADELGSDGEALRRRAARVIGGIINLGLAGSAVSLILGTGSGDDNSARDWTAYILSAPFGQWLVGLAGAGVAAAGVRFAAKGWSASFENELAVGGDIRTWVVPLGRIGYGARGVLFVMIGGFLALAALHADAREAKGLAGALQALQQQPYGWALLAVAAAGLFAFGAFMLVVARYRRIKVPRPRHAARKLKRQGRAAVGIGER